MTLGLTRTGVRRESKVIRLLSIIHNRIILDLVGGFSVVVFGLPPLPFWEEEPGYISFFVVLGDLLTRSNYPSEVFDPVGDSLVLAGI